MALNSNTAFGRYLRTLRERRPLSLDEVESLSQSFPDSINKGYLSRCENGRQLPAFSKVIALSRIYEVPPDVLVERMELDLELERLGGPPTEDRTFAELYKQAKDRLEHGAVWDAYALARDASFVAHTDPVVDNFSDRKEQVLWACMNVATVAAKLGRFRYARYEFEYVDKTKGESEKLNVVVPERLAFIYRQLQRYDNARHFAETAIKQAKTLGRREYLSYVYCNRARLAMDESDADTAVAFFQKAFRIDKELGRDSDCAIDLQSLAHAYLALGRNRAAKRSAEAALRLAENSGAHRTVAFVDVLLGEMEALAGRSTAAVEHWKKAASAGKALNDRLLRFKAELALYRHALDVGNAASARAVERRLKRLAPWIPEQAVELQDFKNLSAAHATPMQRRVATSQPRIDSPDNPLPLSPLPPDSASE